jgi:AcrR family transcriptional regulator
MSYIAERRLEEKEKRRAEILDAAEAVALDVGTDAMTMDQVARKARISRALLYVYFKDKPDLLFAVAERALGLLRERFLAAQFAHRSGLDQITAIGHAYVAFCREFPVYFDVLSKLQGHEAELKDTGSTLQGCLLAGNRVHDVLVQSINAGIADGSVRPDAGDARIVSFVLWAFTHGALEIAKRKAEVLPFMGVEPAALVDQGIEMARRSLAAPG